MSISRTIGETPGRPRAIAKGGRAVDGLNRGTISCDVKLITLATSIVTLRRASCRQILRMLFDGLLSFSILVIGAGLATVRADAQNATWLSSPGSGNWNTASNWQPTIVPIQTAIFGTSNVTEVTFSNNTSVGTLQFNTGAPAYTFNLSGGIGLTITKTGIVNSSSNVPTFSLTTLSSVPAALTFKSASTAGNAAIGGSGTVGFFNTSTAANATINTNHALIQFNGGSTAGDASISNPFGNITFRGTSTAGNAIIQNHPGSLSFFDSSTAGGAFINNFSGNTTFADTSSAGNASITNVGSKTIFIDRSTAGNATIFNASSNMTFADMSSAGNASITNADSTTMFIDRSTAGNATITNRTSLSFADASTAGHAAIHDNGGNTGFNDTSTAGNATIFNQQGQLTFNDTSSAGDAIITNSSGNLFFSAKSTAGQAAISGSGTIEFFNTSTAANATINTTHALIEFRDASTADDASITDTFGTMNFRGTSSAGNAIIQNDVGSLTFFDSSTAGTATITTASGNMTFADMSTAGNASITNADSTTMFIDRSTAGNATIINQQNGQLSFNDTSSAGNAIITNSSNLFFGGKSSAGHAAIGGSGTIEFFNTSTAANATINTTRALIEFNNESTAGDASITNTFGKMNFRGTSSAGNAIIQNDVGFLTFFDSSTAGAATITNASGNMTFADMSSAGNASITNADSTTMFIDRSTAGNATITNFSALIFADASTAAHAVIHDDGGSTSFNDTSTAGNATILNQQNGQLTFNDTSSAGNAIITNSSNLFFNDKSSAGNAAIHNDGGFTSFNDTSTAGNATIFNQQNGQLTFNDTSSAGNAIITNSSTLFFNDQSTAGHAAIGGSGTIEFFDTSTAANATINTTKALIEFNDGSTAGDASITNIFGKTIFRGISTAGNAVIHNDAGSLRFFDSSTAGNATITTIFGRTVFRDTSTAGNAVIRNVISSLKFLDSSTAGHATITNSFGGFTQFTDASSAAHSTITTDFGGFTAFYNTSTGNQARFITRSGGIFDISNLTSAGTTVGSIQGAGTYSLGSKTLTVGLNNLNTQISGAIVDGGLNGGTGGALVKDGTGTLTLSGLDTYSGGTEINLGTLVVASTQALGTGDVTVNGGLLRADPQLINVRGNYTQNAGGTLQLQVGANPGQYDSLNVGGNAALGGTLQLVSLGFQPKAGNQLTLVTTGGVVSGRFAQFVDPFTTGPGFNAVDLVYGRKSVRLEFLNLATPIKPLLVTTNFSSFAVTPSQLPAAKLLDAVQTDPKPPAFVQTDPKPPDFISFLNQEPFANLPNDLQKISPEGLTAFYEISFSNANIQRLNLESRMDDLHIGSNGFSSNMTINGATVNLENRAEADGKSSKAVVEPVLQHTSENRWGVWVTGFGDFVNVNGDGNAQGYNFTTGGVSVGADYRITEQLAIGVMGDYSHTWTSLQPSGNIDVNSGRGGMYATWYHQGLYLDGAIYAGHNSYNSSRSGLGGLADGNTGGTEWSTFLSGGYDFHAGPLTVGPIAALQYTYANVNGFSENGSQAPMQIQTNSVDSLRSDVGFRLFCQWKIGKVLLEPSLKAAWEHEYLYSALPITAGFAGISGPTATFSGPSEGHDSAIVSTGVSAQWTPALTVYLNYDGQLGRGNYDSNAVTGGFRVGF